MTRSGARLAKPLTLGLALLLTPAASRADVAKDECVDSNTRAQSLRRAGSLSQARRELRVCGDPSCPALVREDCARRLDELERAQPTIVFDVKDPSGADVLGAHLKIDGTPVEVRLDGTPLAVDPGEHTFELEAAGRPAVSRTLAIKEGDKDRIERVVLGLPAGAPAGAAVAPGSGAGAGADAAGSAWSGRKTTAVTIAGLGALGVAAGAVLGLIAMTKWNDAKAACPSATDCPDHGLALSDHSATLTYGTGSTIAFVAGGALVVTGAVLFFTGGRARSPEVGLTVVPSPDGAAAVCAGRF